MMREILLENQEFYDINPLLCGEEQCAPSHRFGPAVRNHYLLHYVLSGRGEFRTERGVFLVEPEQIFVIRPGESTVYQADSQEPWRYYWVGFSCNIPIDSILDMDVLDAMGCYPIFQSMMDTFPGGELSICGKIYELLHRLRTSSSVAGGTERYVRIACDYIEANYMKELKVGRIAASLNLDRSYFSHIFKDYTGISPQRYILEYRLDKAAELLTQTNMTMGEIASQVGYTDQLSFSRSFKNHFGVCPSRYTKYSV